MKTIAWHGKTDLIATCEILLQQIRNRLNLETFVADFWTSNVVASNLSACLRLSMIQFAKVKQPTSVSVGKLWDIRIRANRMFLSNIHQYFSVLNNEAFPLLSKYKYCILVYHVRIRIFKFRVLAYLHYFLLLSAAAFEFSELLTQNKSYFSTLTKVIWELKKQGRNTSAQWRRWSCRELFSLMSHFDSVTQKG